MKLNLDALKKQLTTSKSTTSSAEPKKVAPATVAPTSPATPPSPPPSAITKEEKAPASSGLKFVPLGKQQKTEKATSDIKLVPLSELRKKTEEVTVTTPVQTASQDASITTASTVTEQATAPDAEPPAAPVFKNLSKESDTNWETEKDEYKRYRRRKVQKVLMYSSYPIAAVFVLSVVLINSFTELKEPETPYQAAIPAEQSNENVSTTNENLNALAAEPNIEPSELPASGTEVAETFTETFPSLTVEQKETIQSLYNTKETVTGRLVIQGIMDLFKIPNLYGTAGNTQSFEEYWAVQNGLMTMTEMEMTIGNQQLKTVLEKAATTLSSNTPPTAPMPPSSPELPNNVPEQTTTDTVSGNEFISRVMSAFPNMSEEQQMRLIDRFAGVPHVTVSESMSFLWELLEIPPTNIETLAISNGIAGDVEQMEQAATNSQMDKILVIVKSYLPINQ